MNLLGIDLAIKKAPLVRRTPKPGGSFKGRDNIDSEVTYFFPPACNKQIRMAENPIKCNNSPDDHLESAWRAGRLT